MGCYVNPSNVTQEEWLKTEGREATPEEITAIKSGEIEKFIANQELPVVMMDNGRFTAAGIVYSNREAFAFTDPADFRPKMFFVASVEKLKTVSPLANYLE